MSNFYSKQKMGNGVCVRDKKKLILFFYVSKLSCPYFLIRNIYIYIQKNNLTKKTPKKSLVQKKQILFCLPPHLKILWYKKSICEKISHKKHKKKVTTLCHSTISGYLKKLIAKLVWGEREKWLKR